MHEYSLMEQVIELVRREAVDRSVALADIRAVYLRVGALELHSDEAFRQAFRMQAAAAGMGGAELRMEVIPGQLACQHCGYAGPIASDQTDPHDACPVAECPECGHVGLGEGGRGVQDIELEVEDRAVRG